jgi:hypothetical protein
VGNLSILLANNAVVEARSGRPVGLVRRMPPEHKLHGEEEDNLCPQLVVVRALNCHQLLSFLRFLKYQMLVATVLSQVTMHGI